jgi:hypothetical protein
LRPGKDQRGWPGEVDIMRDVAGMLSYAVSDLTFAQAAGGKFLSTYDDYIMICTVAGAMVHTI